MASNITLTYNSKPFHGSTKKNDDRPYQKSKSLFLSDRSWIRSRCTYRKKYDEKCLSSTIYAVTKGSAEPSKSEETVPSWAKPGSDESPPWAREDGEKPASEAGLEAPFFVYLLASAFSAIAAIGSIFEYANQKPVFGVVNPESVFYAPLLGFFVFAGLPGSAYLWFKSVQVANKEAEEQDRRDGFR